MGYRAREEEGGEEFGEGSEWGVGCVGELVWVGGVVGLFVWVADEGCAGGGEEVVD